jgi:1,2-diacylglycerol 3-beta-galactosyltransferase
VEDSGFGKYSSDPQVIADTVCSWLESPETMQSMKDAALAAARPSATLDIARDLADIAFSTKQGQTAKEEVLVKVR